MDYQNVLMIFILQLLIYLFGVTIAEPPRRFCTNSANYTLNSTYQQNLNTLLSSLSTNVSQYGFYNGSIGESSDKVYGIVMCRGDVDLDQCRACINNSTRELVELCPNQKEAIIYYDYCMLRYSNNIISGKMVITQGYTLWSNQTLTSVSEFNEELGILLDILRRQAASGGPFRKFATGNRTAPDFQTMFVLQQCTPDISESECNDCLSLVALQIPICCNGKRGMRVLVPSCILRYETYKFFDNNSFKVEELPSSEGKNDSTPKSRTIIVTLVFSISGSLMLIFCIRYFIRRHKKKLLDKKSDTTEEISDVESLLNSFDTIKTATNNFSDANKLGEGGFGVVYKGELPNGQKIAVKRLSSGSAQGDLEFMNEVQLVAKLQHRNLVRLLGFCLERSERLLIYEFMPNESLDRLIYDPVKRANLDWDRRYNIIEGITKGLVYLHEDSRLRIIHRDLKASNVLLNEEMNPKISDFGMARLFVLDQSHGNTNRIVGTYGYMPPEYVSHGQFSVKSDVFSFGVLVLEIISGKKYNNLRDGEYVESLPSYAWKNWRNGTVKNLIDPLLRARSRSMRDIMRCIHIALLCVQNNVSDRPTMTSVLLMITSLSLTLPVPSEPAFLMHDRLDSNILRQGEDINSSVLESGLLSERNYASASINEASITELYPR